MSLLNPWFSPCLPTSQPLHLFLDACRSKNNYSDLGPLCPSMSVCVGAQWGRDPGIRLETHDICAEFYEENGDTPKG